MEMLMTMLLRLKIGIGHSLKNILLLIKRIFFLY